MSKVSMSLMYNLEVIGWSVSRSCKSSEMSIGLAFSTSRSIFMVEEVEKSSTIGNNQLHWIQYFILRWYWIALSVIMYIPLRCQATLNNGDPMMKCIVCYKLEPRNELLNQLAVAFILLFLRLSDSTIQQLHLLWSVSLCNPLQCCTKVIEVIWPKNYSLLVVLNHLMCQSVCISIIGFIYLSDLTLQLCI